jgi:hypothetical protein
VNSKGSALTERTQEIGMAFRIDDRLPMDKTGEDVMRTSQRSGLWLLAAALLASVEFSYAHLPQVGFWPLQLIASSLWRLAGAQAGPADSAPAVWAPAAALILAGLLAELSAAWIGRRLSWRESLEGDDHE